MVEKQCSKSIKVFYANSGGKFILAKLKDFCNKKNITIKYKALYMHKKSGIMERR